MKGVFLVLAIGCHSPSAPAPAPARTEIHVDRRVELVSIVERVAGASAYANVPPTAYTADVDRQFGTLANEPVIATAKELNYDGPMELAVQLDDHLNARVPKWRDLDVAAFASQLRAFAEHGKFDAFFAAHHDYYAAVEQRMRAGLDAEHPADWFDGFFGARASARFAIVPGLLEGPNNYGVHFSNDEMYQVLGLGQPDQKGLPDVDEEMIETLIHEMAHSYVNPVFDAHHAELEAPGKALFEIVAKPMTEMAYGQWEIVLNESGVRAVTTLYLRDRKSPQVAASHVKAEMRAGFVWAGELADALAHEKAKGKDFAGMVPAVAHLFDDLAKRYAAHGLPKDFIGPINAAFEGQVALVLADGAPPELAKFVGEVREQFYAKAPFGPAAPDHVNVVAYGTPADPVIAAALARGHAVVAADRIALGDHAYPGGHLVLIASWARDGDPEHGVVVYTAADPRDLIEINSLRHGGTDWMIGRKTDHGFEQVAAGNW